MPALSILHMHMTMREQERIQAERDAAAYARLTEAEKAEKLHYWHVERRSKRKVNGQYRWIFVRELFATKPEAAKIFIQHYGPGYRLRHMYSYQ